jgi:hypothetical protein
MWMFTGMKENPISMAIKPETSLTLAAHCMRILRAFSPQQWRSRPAASSASLLLPGRMIKLLPSRRADSTAPQDLCAES